MRLWVVKDVVVGKLNKIVLTPIIYKIYEADGFIKGLLKYHLPDSLEWSVN